MKNVIKNLLLASFSCFAATLSAYEVTLMVTNAQVGQLIIGCDARATDGHDKALDIFVPPMGMGSGIVGIKADDHKTQKNPADMYYRDMRADHYPQAWKISCQIPKKPMTFTWSTENMPPDVTFTIRLDNGKTMDMRTQKRLSVQQTGILTITAFQAKTTPEAEKN